MHRGGNSSLGQDQFEPRHDICRQSNCFAKTLPERLFEINPLTRVMYCNGTLV